LRFHIAAVNKDCGEDAAAQPVKNIQCPILGNYAGADKGITEADINLLKQMLSRYGKEFDLKVYPGAKLDGVYETKQPQPVGKALKFRKNRFYDPRPL
jgi:dienelactone hydrolase